MGQVLKGLYDEGFPPKPHFAVEDIPDLTGKVTIVTGGNTGIGKETVKALLSKNAKVYMASRSQKKAEVAIADLKKATGKEAIFLELDLANLKAIKKAAETFLGQEKELHVLFNNGGVMVPAIELLTEDGYDLQFGTNALGHFYFTQLVLPALLEAAKSSPDGISRVITTASSAHLLCKKIDYDTLKDSKQRKKKGKNALYAQSKFGNIIVAKELAKRYGDQGIVSISLNPGNLKTDLQRHTTALQHWIIDRLTYEAPLGALTQLWAGLSEETKGFNGKYLKPWARLGAARSETQDAKEGEKLWNWLEEQTKDV